MKTFTIAVVQQTSPVSTKAANLAATMDWVEKAHRKGASLVLLPELNITGHAGCRQVVAEAEPVPGGPCVAALADLAGRLGIHIAAGIAEDERGIHYNTQFIVGPDGYLGKQRKVHLSNDEYFYFRGGTELPVFELPFARVGLIICYDNLFPEIARCLAVRGAEVLLAPHAARFGAWPRTEAGRRKAVAENKKLWRTIFPCRALDNGTWLTVCNAAGRSADRIRGVEANHAGGCMVVGPQGEVAAESRARGIAEELVVVELDAARVAARRCASGFNLQTRRPDVFGALTEPTT